MQAVVGALHIVATLGALYSLLCRLSAMHGPSAPATARHQHALLFGALTLSLCLPPEAGQAAMATGVLGYLALSAHRWHRATPWNDSDFNLPSDWPSPPDR